MAVIVRLLTPLTKTGGDHIIGYAGETYDTTEVCVVVRGNIQVILEKSPPREYKNTAAVSIPFRNVGVVEYAGEE